MPIHSPTVPSGHWANKNSSDLWAHSRLLSSPWGKIFGAHLQYNKRPEAKRQQKRMPLNSLVLPAPQKVSNMMAQTSKKGLNCTFGVQVGLRLLRRPRVNDGIGLWLLPCLGGFPISNPSLQRGASTNLSILLWEPLISGLLLLQPRLSWETCPRQPPSSSLQGSRDTSCRKPGEANKAIHVICLGHSCLVRASGSCFQIKPPKVCNPESDLKQF